jgi:tetratricopeptide (TPR) repeat protein
MESYKVTNSVLLRVLRGVAAATLLAESSYEPLVRCFSCGGTTEGANGHADDDFARTLSPNEWLATVLSIPCDNEENKLLIGHLANLVLGIAFLRERGRMIEDDSHAAASAADLTVVWKMILGALLSVLFRRSNVRASRSAQGFLSVPLCSLVNDGNIEELFRLHVWLPDGQRGTREFAVHSHQPFGQSWVLAGAGVDHSFDVQQTTDFATATHAEYRLAWQDEKDKDESYKTHQISSTVMNTGNLVRVIATGSRQHTRDMTYSIPAAAFHRTEVLPDTLHATLFFFDASRGFVKNAPVLGPKDLDSSTQLRDPGGITPAALATMVDAVRSWEMLIEQGEQHAKRAEWEHALRSFSHAISLCGPAGNLPNSASYKHIALGKLGYTNRRFGRYDKAEEYLKCALNGLGSTPLHVDVRGEMGVVYRHMNRLGDAKREFETQYKLARGLNLEHAMCRSIGNLGMINYQLSKDMLPLAIGQLKERIRLARSIQASMGSGEKNEAIVWEIIGLSRLSLCYTACGLTKEAIGTASDSVKVAVSVEDPTVVAMSRFFYGRALLRSGQLEKALQQFNPIGACTPAMALCKEPSNEHLAYLRELVEAGADMDLVDEQGYSALDYAVFCGDKQTEEVVIDGLRRQFGEQAKGKILQRQREARVRKCYRELLQESLRPVLLENSDDVGQLQHLRRVYTATLAADEEKSTMFDGLKFVWYLDFVHNGRLPRSNHGLTQNYRDIKPEIAPEYIVFISYRWINGDPAGIASPDDTNHTQYRRMIRAIEAFLSLHSSMDPGRLGIWLVGP